MTRDGRNHPVGHVVIIDDGNRLTVHGPYNTRDGARTARDDARRRFPECGVIVRLVLPTISKRTDSRQMPPRRATT